MVVMGQIIAGWGLVMGGLPMEAFEYKIVSNAADSTLNGHECVLLNLSDVFTEYMADVQNGEINIVGESERSFPAQLYFINDESSPRKTREITFIVEPGTTVVDLNKNELVTCGPLTQKLQDYLNEREAYWKATNKTTGSNPNESATANDFIHPQINLNKAESLTSDKVISQDQNVGTVSSLEELELKAKEIFKENFDNGLGEYVLISYGGIWSPDEWEEAVHLLDEDRRELEAIRSITSRMDRLKNTWVGKPFVELEGKNLEGEPAKLSDYVGNGEFVIVDIWARWCGGCIVEARETLLPLYNKYKDNPKVKFIGIALDDVRDMAKKMGLPWEQLMECKRVMGIYGINSIPEIILFGPDGTVLNRHLRGTEVEEKLKAAMQTCQRYVPTNFDTTYKF